MAAKTRSDARAAAERCALTVEGAVAYSGMSRTRLMAALGKRLLIAKRAERGTLIVASSLRSYIGSLPGAR